MSHTQSTTRDTTQDTELRSLRSMKTYLNRMCMDQAAQDFYLTRKSKQMDQAKRDPTLYEHTAISHFMQWHCLATGARVPIQNRMSQRTIWAGYKRFTGENSAST